VLVVEDNPANLRLVQAVLARDGYRVEAAGSLAAADAALRSARPDLIVMDVALPDGSGLDLTRRLKADPATADIPIVAVTASAMPGDAERARAAGCDAHLTKPINTRTFAAQVASAIGRRACAQGGSPLPRLLLVDDDPTSLRLLRGMLSAEGYVLEDADGGDAALRAVERQAPDLVVLDLAMPGVDGFAVLRRLKGAEATRLIPCVVVTAADEREQRLRAVELGADEFLSKPVDRAELQARVRALLRLKTHIDALEHVENVLLAFARSVEARDPDTRDHCERMARRATALGRVFGLGEEALRALRLAAFLHDLGKIGLPDAVLLKPGPLTQAERMLVRHHPVLGEEILEPLRTMDAVRPLVRHHHERLDGSGYPDGLSGAEISITTRILSVCDVFDALTTHRPYRLAMPTGQAFAVLDGEVARGYWDGNVIEELKRLVATEG
jgi:putative two-component system response regulator